MRTLFFLVLTAILFSNAYAVDDPPTFEITVSISADSPGRTSKGSAGFTVSENQYGKVSITLFDDLNQFRLQAVGSRQIPFNYLLENGSTFLDNNFRQIIELYLRPTIMANGKILIEGVIHKLSRSQNQPEPLYAYNENRIKFDIENGGEFPLKLETNQTGKKVNLIIRAITAGDLTYKPKTYDNVTFRTDYSFYNITDKKYEMKDRHCTLGLIVNNERSQGNCSHRKLFHLNNGDLLLFLSTYSINNLFRNPDKSVAFDFEVAHIYALNPEDTSATANELKSDKTSVKMFNRRVTVAQNEKTEIEIPVDKSGPLPFEAKETILLFNADEFIPVDRMPEQTYAPVPKYPEKAYNEGVTGQVTVKVFIDKNGLSQNAQIVKCDRPGYGFEEAALKAANLTKYLPAIQKEKPVGAWVTYRIVFAIE